MTASATGALRPLTVDDGVRDAEWMQRAACVDVEPETFFPIGTSGPALAQEQEAKRVCAGCPVRRECLSWSYRTRSTEGIFGGLTADERASLSRRSARARRDGRTREGVTAS